MNFNRIINYGVIVLLIGVFAFLFFRERNNTINFTELIEREHLEDINLTIYYMNPLTFIFWPPDLSVEELMSEHYEYRIVIAGTDLQKYANLLKQLDSVTLITVESEHPVDARVYYRFENKRSGERFSVVISTFCDYILVNGSKVEEHPIFYEVLKPFVPEHEIRTLEMLIELFEETHEE
jgi:hypothetical protein